MSLSQQLRDSIAQARIRRAARIHQHDCMGRCGHVAETELVPGLFLCESCVSEQDIRFCGCWPEKCDRPCEVDEERARQVLSQIQDDGARDAELASPDPDGPHCDDVDRDDG